MLTIYGGGGGVDEATLSAAIGVGAERNIVRDGATTGSADNTAIIQAAIDAVATAGGGIVEIPEGEFISGPLVMKTRVQIRGRGPNSVLKLKDGSNAHFFTLADGNTEQVGFVDVRLDGNKANQTTGNIVHLDNTGYDTGRGLPSPGDPSHYMTRVNLSSAKVHGLYTSGQVAASRFLSVWAWGCSGNSFYLSSPDNLFTDCVSGNSGLEGFYIASNSNRLFNCKAFTAGALLDINHAFGFAISGCDRIDLIAFEAQDNRGHGIVVVNTKQSMITGRVNRNGLGIESGGVSPGDAGSGIYAEGVTDSRIDLVAYDHNNGGLKQRWAYLCGNNNNGNIVDIAAGEGTGGTTVGIGSWGSYSTFRLTHMGKTVAQATPPMSATTQTGTTYTLAAADAGTVVESSNASAVTVTVPPNSTTAFPVGTVIEVHQLGAGQVTIAPGAGVTLRSRGGALKSAGQYGVLSLRKRDTNEWVVAGDATT